MDGDLFYCLKLKIPLGMVKSSVFFPLEMRSQFSFPIGMKFLGIFLTREDFLANSFGGQGVPPGLSSFRDSSYRGSRYGESTVIKVTKVFLC